MNVKEERELYHQYETELFSIENKTKVHKPPYWWENSIDAVFLPIYQHQNIIGFVIVGYGKFIDSDVKSEVCEIYLHPSHRNSIALKKLLQNADPYLKLPWGFQVLKANIKAKLLFESLLKRYGKSYSKKLSLDGITTVYKYRVSENIFR